MTKRWALVSMLFAVGCGGSGVSIQGDDPTADGRAVTEAICEWQADCGEWDIDCTQTNGMVDCTATRTAVTFQQCQTEEQQDIIDDFTCAGDLSAAEADLVERCVNAITDTSCITQAEMDAYIAALERGEEPMSLRDEPAECEGLDTIFERCQP